MARRSQKSVPRGRVLLRWLGVGTLAFIAFLYSQPLRSYFSTRDALAQQSAEVRALRAQKLRLERRLADSDTPQALTREARRLGYVEPGERLFIVKGIAAWRRNHEAKDKREPPAPEALLGDQRRAPPEPGSARREARVGEEHRR